MNERNKKLDNLKGLLILLVVLGHLLFSYQYYNSKLAITIVNFIYTFHMPLFLIISGYLSKNVQNKNLFKIVVMFFLVNFSFIIYDYIRTGHFDILTIKYSSWYLLALFLYRGLLKISIIKDLILKSKKISLSIIFILSLLAGFLSFDLIKIISYSFFFFFGYCLKLEKINISSKSSLLNTILIMLILIALVYFFPFDLSFYMGESYSFNSLIFLRGIIYFLDVLLFINCYNLISNKNSFLTKLGRNSLGIYCFHRIPTLLITNLINGSDYFYLIVIVSSIVLCIILGSNRFNRILNKFLDYLYNFFVNNLKLFSLFVLILIIVLIFLYFLLNGYISFKNRELYVSYEESVSINNSISIGFVGDLILLENQVKDYEKDDIYHFDYMFKDVKDYFIDTNYMIGVLEGPVDDEAQYSVGNFDDGKRLYLNYPTSFVASIKTSGIDLVTIANNHILDKGLESYEKTKNNLKILDLDFVGEHKNYKIIDIEGLSVGVLSYTYGLNYVNEDELFEKYENVTNYLVSSDSKYFKKVKNSVEDDFSYLKEQNVDLIVVLPHYGTQFSKTSDDYQKLWNRIFASNGADIIFGSHSHSVQPVEFLNETIIFNSVGNFVNSYIEHDGDVSIMAKVYINPQTKKIICGSIIPLLAVKSSDFGYYSLPVYKTYQQNDNLDINLFERIRYSNKLVTNITLDKEIGIEDAEEEYLIFKDGFKRQYRTKFSLLDSDKESLIYKSIEKVDNVCFIGDSITEGTKNGFNPWYLPLIQHFSDKNIYNISKGGYTSFDILNNFKDDVLKANCELSIINIGTNDIRYNKTNVDEYIFNINGIIDLLDNKDIILLSPWRTTYKDNHLKKDTDEKIKLYDEYDKELKDLAENNLNINYINANNYIKEAITKDGENTYLLDGVHPNNGYGIALYSYATMRSNF